MTKKTAAEGSVLAGMLAFFVSGVVVALTTEKEIVQIILAASVTGGIFFFGSFFFLSTVLKLEDEIEFCPEETAQVPSGKKSKISPKPADGFVETKVYPKISDKNKGRKIDITVKDNEDLYKSLFK